MKNIIENMAKLVSKVYGDALFSAALEENKLDEVWEEVRQISSILEENKAFVDMMNHPEMTREKELALMDEICSAPMVTEGEILLLTVTVQTPVLPPTVAEITVEPSSSAVTNP